MNECTELMEEYKKNADINTKDPFISEVNSELIDFKKYMTDMKNIKSKSFYSQIENSIKNINKNNISNSININNQSSRILKSIEKKLNNTSSIKKSSGYKPIQNIENTFRKKIQKQNQEIQQEDENQEQTLNEQTIQNQRQTSQSQRQIIQNQRKIIQNQEQTTKNQDQTIEKNKNIYKSVFNNLRDSKNLVKRRDENEKITTEIMKYRRPNKLKIINQISHTQKKPINSRTPTKANFIKNENNNNNKKIQVLQTKFKGEGEQGDFKWELQEKIDPKSIYIYIDKEENTSNRDKKITIYDKDNRYPRSFGILIKEKERLTIPVKNRINKEIEKISFIIKEGNYKKIKYNFKDIDETIKDYLEYKIKNL